MAGAQLTQMLPGTRRIALVAVLAFAVPAGGAPHNKPTKQHKEADRLVKNGVALFSARKFTEALAEFQRAYDISHAPGVLYNIAACHRELSQYGDAVAIYQRFLTEGAGKVPKARLTRAKAELDDVLARTARVTVNITPGDAQLIVDGTVFEPPIAMPLILAPGDHQLSAHVDGKQDAARVVHVASGDELAIELVPLAPPPPEPAPPEPVMVARHTFTVTAVASDPVVSPSFVRVRIGAAYGANLQATRETGAPELGLGLGLGSRVELGVDVVLVAYAVIPTLRVRLVGDRFSVHLIGAAPIAFETGPGAMSQTFVAGAGGLGFRLRATSHVGLHLEGFASFASAGHGTTFPAFVGGDVWF